MNEMMELFISKNNGKSIKCNLCNKEFIKKYSDVDTRAICYDCHSKKLSKYAHNAKRRIILPFVIGLILFFGGAFLLQIEGQNKTLQAIFIYITISYVIQYGIVALRKFIDSGFITYLGSFSGLFTGRVVVFLLPFLLFVVLLIVVIVTPIYLIGDLHLIFRTKKVV